MKYKIGDKVRYDGGDWWFYGTVSAVFEHSISPCYRLNVERMEKKSCKFSITQFEFELEPYHQADDAVKDKRKWDNAEIELLKRNYGTLSNEDLSKLLKRSPKSIEDKRQQLIPDQESVPMSAEAPEQEPVKRRKRRSKAEMNQESETEKVEVVQKPGKEAKKAKISESWLKHLEMFQKGEKSGSIYNWTSINRKLYKTGELPEDKLEKLNEIDFPFDAERKKVEKVEKTPKPKKERQKRKRGEAWDSNFEMYRNGEKSNAISSWVAQNRKDYKNGTLPENKLDKLLEVNFPFETTFKKKTDNWHIRLEEWKKGERRSTLVQQWRQRSIKKYLEGKLEIDKIAKLKEIGILS